MSAVDKIADNGLKIIAVEPPIDGAHRENDGYNFVRSAFEKLPEGKEGALRKYMEPGQTDEKSKRELTDALTKNGVSEADQAKLFVMLDAMRSSNPPLHLPDGFKLGTQPVEPGAKPTPEQQHQRELWANTTQNWRNATFAAAIKDQMEKYDHDPANAHPGKPHNAKVMIFAGRYHLEPHKSADGTTQGTTLDELNKLHISGVAIPIRTKLMDPP
jgi:hypothetical protein